MGPRRIRRGELLGLVEFGTGLRPSMGPRRIRRGERLRFASSRRSQTAFNGATANSPWRTRKQACSSSRAPASLQWGHGEFAVENIQSVVVTKPIFHLQWGHGEFAVENAFSN